MTAQDGPGRGLVAVTRAGASALADGTVQVRAGRRYELACLRCTWRGEPALQMRCPVCTGAVEPVLDLTGATVGMQDDPLRAYANFLPLDDADLAGCAGVMTRTPCRAVPRLGQAIGVPNLWVKDESRQPTGTTKDRLAAVVVTLFRQFGVTEFASSSTGNTATALARAVLRDGTMRATFFCGTNFIGRHGFSVDDRVRLTFVDGSYVDASHAGKAYAREHDVQWEGGFFNWARREGLKIAWLEAFDQMPATPDVVVQAISSGMGIAAADKGVREYVRLGRASHVPRMLMAQQDTCAPMVAGWQAGRTELTELDVVVDPQGLATAILLGDGADSYPYLAGIAASSGGAIVAVSQDDLVRTRALLHELEGLDVCYSAAAAVAGLAAEAAAGRIGNELVLVNLTGRDRQPSEPGAHWTEATNATPVQRSTP